MRRSTKKKLGKMLYPTPQTAVNLLIWAVILYGAGYFVNYLIHNSRFFLVKKVEVTGNRYLETTVVKDSVKVINNQRMFSVNLPEVTDDLLKNKYIRGVSVSRVLPSTILVDVQEREPFLYMVDKSIYMVDETGLILKKLPRMPMGKLPIVTGVPVAEMQNDSTALPSTIALIQRIKEVDPSLLSLISEININKNKQPELVLIKGAARVKLGDTNQYERLYILSEFLNKKPIIEKLQEIKQIDLTFADRIVVQNKG